MTISLSPIVRIDNFATHWLSDLRPGFADQGNEAAWMDAPNMFPSGSARCDETPWGSLYDFEHCGCREYAGRVFSAARRTE